MPKREDRASVDVLREAARERVEQTGLREMARQVGMPHVSLSEFLSGRTPHAANAKKLREWYEGDEVLKLKRRVAELEKKLAECEKKRGTG